MQARVVFAPGGRAARDFRRAKTGKAKGQVLRRRLFSVGVLCIDGAETLNECNGLLGKAPQHGAQFLSIMAYAVGSAERFGGRVEADVFRFGAQVTRGKKALFGGKKVK